MCRVGEEPDGELPAWVHVVRAEGTAVHALLPDVMATVIPRPKNRYNDLALPVKLFDYLSFGRPLIVTNCDETARLVRDARCGLVVGDATLQIADGIRQLCDGPISSRRRLGEDAAVRHRPELGGARQPDPGCAWPLIDARPLDLDPCLRLRSHHDDERRHAPRRCCSA